MISEFLIALAVDLYIGEAPLRFHPTVKMGNFISRFTPKQQPRIKPRSPKRHQREFATGMTIGLGGMVASAALATIAERSFNRLPKTLSIIANGIALKHSFSLRELIKAAQAVEAALLKNDLPEARRLLSWHLVSRDTRNLSESEIAGATIESIAENLSDSFIAPLVMFRIGGLPAAFVYRFANTADAMLGYRTPQFEWLGKFPARTDDLLNLIPSRLTALFIALAAGIHGKKAMDVFSIAYKEASATSSPNAGWPMSAMAGALNCKLDKRGCYTLNSDAPPPSVKSIGEAIKIIKTASGIAAAIMAISYLASDTSKDRAASKAPATGLVYE